MSEEDVKWALAFVALAGFVVFTAIGGFLISPAVGFFTLGGTSGLTALILGLGS